MPRCCLKRGALASATSIARYTDNIRLGKPVLLAGERGRPARRYFVHNGTLEEKPRQAGV